MSHFYMFVSTNYTVKLANRNMGHAQGIGNILCRFPKLSHYIQRGQFIIFQSAITTPSYQVTSNFMLVFKRLHMNLLKILTLLTLKVILVDHPTRLKTI